MTARHDAAAYKIGLKDLNDDQLFEAWSQAYDERNAEHVALIITEMNTRHVAGVTEL